MTAMNEEPNEMVKSIRDVWSGHEDFEEGGWNYVAFVILQDLREMEESGWDQGACNREMADVAINALRALDELGVGDAETAVKMRVNEHDRKDTEDIIERYQDLYERRL